MDPQIHDRLDYALTEITAATQHVDTAAADMRTATRTLHAAIAELAAIVAEIRNVARSTQTQLARPAFDRQAPHTASENVAAVRHRLPEHHTNPRD